MAINTQVHELRPDGLGGIWARVIVDVPHSDKPQLGDAIDINLHLPGAASLGFAEAEDRAKQAAWALLKRVANQV